MPTDLHELMATLPSKGVDRANKVGLALAAGVTPNTRDALLARLTGLARERTGDRQTLTAWLGDLLVHAGQLRRGQLGIYAAAAGLEPGTLSNAKMVCARIPFSCRHEGLSWTHHCEVGLLISDPNQIERWLVLAEVESLAASALRRRIRIAHAASPRQDDEKTEFASAFRLMRELRAAARMVARQQALWTEWPHSTARLALDELAPLAKFFALLRRKTKSTAHFASNEPPRDISAN